MRECVGARARARVCFERCTVVAFASGQGARHCRYTYKHIKCMCARARYNTHTHSHRQRWPCGHSRVLVPPSIYVDTLKAAFTTNDVRHVKLLNARSRPRSPRMDIASSRVRRGDLIGNCGHVLNYCAVATGSPAIIPSIEI